MRSLIVVAALLVGCGGEDVVWDGAYSGLLQIAIICPAKTGSETADTNLFVREASDGSLEVATDSCKWIPAKLTGPRRAELQNHVCPVVKDVQLTITGGTLFRDGTTALRVQYTASMLSGGASCDLIVSGDMHL